jgi:L-amino acid N-acyltransferase YncA
MRIRLAVPSDGPRLATIYEPAVVGSTLSIELTAPDGAEMSRRVVETMAHRPWLVAEAESILGYAYASPHRVRLAYAWSVEVSIYTAPEAHRQGLGRALYTSIFAVLSLQGFQNAYAGVTVPNPVSSAFHEAMGFELIGTYRRVGFKLGHWLDTRWYGRSLGNHPLDPAPPRALPDVVGSPDFEDALQAGMTVWRPPGPAAGAPRAV